ncbi:MAG TPA: nickel insertion protein, partial [Terriglobales bacterium]|nr:nickel insertion protein [Terriglobales bacterium]
MRIAYLDCFSGISGDMFLGALVDAGVSARLFEETAVALDLGARLEISRVNRSGITATKVDVFVHGEKELPREEHWEQGHAHHHPHESQSRAGAPAPHGHGRSLSQIKQIIGEAAIGETARSTAIGIFEALGAAEAKIHEVPIETIHFHEVGAVDALVDIVCAAVGVEALGVDEIICSPLNVGGGTVKCAHG